MERGNSFCDVKRKPYKCSSRKRESIEAQEGGGSSRISDEDAVMVLERRGCGNLYKSMDNQKWEELSSLCIVVESRGTANKVVRSRMSREEAHVRSLWGAGGEIPPVYPAACRQKAGKN